MKIFIKNMMTLLACLMFLVCSGCGIKAESDKNKVAYSVTDVTGTVIEFSEKPKRIVSMGIGSDEILLELVEPERIAALTYLADDAGISSVSVKAQVIKGRVQRNNLEAILSYAPDLVVAPDWDGIDFVGQLRSAGIKVYVHKTPNTMQEIKANIAELAAAVGEDEQGYLLQQQMDERLSAIWSKVGKIKPEQRKKIVALSFMGPMGIKGSSFDDMCHYANIINAVENLDIPRNAAFSEEQMLLLDPDIILVPSWDYSGTKNTGEFQRQIMTNEAYQGIKAIRNHQVVQVHDRYLYSTSQYAVNAVEELAAVSYPELY